MVTGVASAQMVPISGDADLVFAQVLQQESLERLVGAIDLVDQQHRAGLGRL